MTSLKLLWFSTASKTYNFTSYVNKANCECTLWLWHYFVMTCTESSKKEQKANKHQVHAQSVPLTAINGHSTMQLTATTLCSHQFSNVARKTTNSHFYAVARLLQNNKTSTCIHHVSCSVLNSLWASHADNILDTKRLRNNSKVIR